MIHITCDAEKLEELRYEHFHHPHPRVQMKMAAVHMTVVGIGRDQVAAVLGCTTETVTTYLKTYQQGGVDALRRFKVGGQRSVLDAHNDTLRAEFEQRPARSVKEAQHRIKKLTGVQRSPSQVRVYLRRLGLGYRKVAPIPAKAQPEVQETFLTEQLEPVLDEAKRNQRHVFFVDASHFVLGAFLGFLWSFTRVFVRTPSGRQRYNVLGALDAITHEVVTLTNTGYINSQSVVELLVKLKEHCSLPITVVLDNAAYQRCALVRDKAAELGIHLLFLPPYSPNLNLIERLWKFVKAECLNSVYYESFPAFKKAIDECLKKTGTEYKPQLDTLLTLKFQRFKSAS